MADNKEIKNLFAEFPPITTEEWEAKINKDLKGADYERKLVWRTLEGFNVRPYYRAENLENLEHLTSLPGEFPYVRGTKKENAWEIRQDICVCNIEKANNKAVDALKRGATAIGFWVSKKTVASQADFSQLVKNIDLEKTPLFFNVAADAPAFAEMLSNEIKEQKINKENVKGSIEFDVIGHLTITGNCYDNEKCDGIAVAKKLIEFAKENLPKVKVVAVNGQYIHNSGSTIVQELGLSLAMGNDYLAKLTEEGLKIDDAAKSMIFNFAVSSNYFMEIAKYRAGRMLWAKIVEAYKPECNCSGKMKIHSTTSMWNKTAYDPYVNMLRTTTESMSAILGGSDSVTVLPFNTSFEKSGEFSERIARNTQIVLKEEAHFGKIQDPSAGSYYIETLTTSIAEHAWKIFTEIEEKGGYISAFKEGFVQNMIKETSQKRDMNIAMRKEILLGTNQFPNFNEEIAKDLNQDIYKKDWIKSENPSVEPLKMYRASEAFEELRLNTEKSEKRPKAYMLTIGNLAMRKARATFACNFFACAGFEVKDNLGFKTVEEGVKASLENNADIVVICSSDDEYATLAPEIYEQLKDKAIVVVAGYPKAHMEALKEKGIENFIHVKSNVLETLTKFQKQLGL